MKKEIVMKKEDSAGVLEKGWLDAGSRRIDEIIIHCSATPAGRDVRVADIRRWHVEERGWRDVGYHFVVCLDGRIERGRPLWKAGAHCMGHNSHSVGVCYVRGGCGDASGRYEDSTAEGGYETAGGIVEGTVPRSARVWPLRFRQEGMSEF